MSKLLTLVAMMSLFVGFSCLNAEQKLSKTVPIEIPLNEDGRKWELIREEEVGGKTEEGGTGQTLLEFMPEGQDPNDWKEVLTVHYFYNDKIVPKQLFDLFMQDIEAQTGPTKLKTEVLEDTETNVLAKWVVTGTSQDQTELVRVFSNGKILAIIRYANRSSTPSKDLLAKWQGILEKSEIK